MTEAKDRRIYGEMCPQLPSGATFDIHFQVIDEDTQAVVLTSDCYQYTVR